MIYPTRSFTIISEQLRLILDSCPLTNFQRNCLLGYEIEMFEKKSKRSMVAINAKFKCLWTIKPIEAYINSVFCTVSEGLAMMTANEVSSLADKVLKDDNLEKMGKCLELQLAFVDGLSPKELMRYKYFKTRLRKSTLDHQGIDKVEDFFEPDVSENLDVYIYSEFFTNVESKTMEKWRGKEQVFSFGEEMRTRSDCFRKIRVMEAKIESDQKIEKEIKQELIRHMISLFYCALDRKVDPFDVEEEVYYVSYQLGKFLTKQWSAAEMHKLGNVCKGEGK